MVGIEKRMAYRGQRMSDSVYRFAVYTPTARFTSAFARGGGKIPTQCAIVTPTRSVSEGLRIPRSRFGLRLNQHAFTPRLAEITYHLQLGILSIGWNGSHSRRTHGLVGRETGYKQQFAGQRSWLAP